MTKWRVEYSRESTDWVAPWKAISPDGEATHFYRWHEALDYANYKARKEATQHAN